MCWDASCSLSTAVRRRYRLIMDIDLGICKQMKQVTAMVKKRVRPRV